MLITNQEILKNYVASKCLWHGIPSIEVTKKGRIFLTFYSGGVREGFGNFVLLVKSEDGVHFSDPVAVCYEEGHRCFDPCVWIDPLGRLWLTWTKSPSEGLYGAICEDPDGEEIVFGEEFFIGNNIMMNKPIVLSTGEWAFPLAVWNYGLGVLPEQYASPVEPKGSYMYITSDQGNTFRRLGYADVQYRSFDEHMFLELQSGVIRCFVRTKYGIGAADSYDGGLHWGKDFDTGYRGPCTRFHIRRLPSGRVLLINHYNYTGRNNLYAMLSEDDGNTFPYRLLLDPRDNVSYPDAAVGADGRIYITYDRERGAACQSIAEIMDSAREILTACITEEDILKGSLVTEGSYLQRIACKLTSYDGDLQNPFDEPQRFSDGKYADYLTKKAASSEDVITEIFNAYSINCTNIHNIDAENMDKLIEEYKKSQSLDALNQIITIVRSAQAESIYKQESIVSEICKYIIENLEHDYTVEAIAKHFHFSSHYIRHIFKIQTGTSISSFRNAQRMQKAKLLLKSRTHKITDIASVCGFESPSYFTETFTKEVGVSPLSYRQALQEKE